MFLLQLFFSFLWRMCSQAVAQENCPFSEVFQTASSSMCSWNLMSVFKTFEISNGGTHCRSNVSFQLPLIRKGEIVVLFRLVIWLHWGARGSSPNQSSHQNELLPELILHWIWDSAMALFFIIKFQTKDCPVRSFFATGWALWQYFTLKNRPHNVSLLLKIHHS